MRSHYVSKTNTALTDRLSTDHFSHLSCPADLANCPAEGGPDLEMLHIVVSQLSRQRKQVINSFLDNFYFIIFFLLT